MNVARNQQRHVQTHSKSTANENSEEAFRLSLIYTESVIQHCPLLLLLLHRRLAQHPLSVVLPLRGHR